MNATTKLMNAATAALIGLLFTVALSVVRAETAPVAKILLEPEDPTRRTVLVGRVLAGDMIIQFEIEPAKAMWMAMGTPPRLVEHPVGAGELYHVEVKPSDSRSKTRIPYADITFAATNKDNGRKVEGTLHPMWGGSGLHYAMNSQLAGDGVYDVVVTVGAPVFGRAPADKDLWMRQTKARFHFKLAGGKLVEVSEPVHIE